MSEVIYRLGMPTYDELYKEVQSMRRLNMKPYKATFILDNWEIISSRNQLRIKGNSLNDIHTIITTAPIIKYDEEEGWAETQIYIYKLLKRKGGSLNDGDRLENDQESELEGRTDRAYQDAAYSPGMVRKA